MQDLSFSFPTPHFQLGGFEFSVLIYTFRNVYAPDEAQMTVEQPGDTLWAEGKGLRWARWKCRAVLKSGPASAAMASG